MLKKIKKENILKIVSIETEGYLRVNYVSPNALVKKAVLKLKKNIQEIPEIDVIVEKAEIIITADNEDELNSFSSREWIKVSLMLN